MLKRVFIAIFIFLIIVVALTGYGLFRSRQEAAERARLRQNAKAPDEQITIIEGWGAKDIGEMLGKKGILQPAEFMSAQKNFDSSGYPALASKPAKADLEGFLFPDTYRIAAGPNLATSTIAQGILKKLLDNFSLKFTEQMREDAAAKGRSIYEIVTLASIIEKETGRNVTSAAGREALDEERKIIAGIFYNRLEIGMALESDATVNYITGKNDPAVLNSDTEIDSPYNTYKYRGLPPGPICNPSLSSLLAAIYPKDNNYVYFLHAQPNGQVYYAKTYEEHLANKQKYLR